MSEFEGRSVLVTGAARGIGRATALHFAERGADVAANDLDGDGLAELGREIEALGRRALAVPGNVGVEEDARRIVDTSVAELGRLDVLVNNAGVWIIKSLEETSAEEWDRQLDTNLRAAYLLSRRAIPALRESDAACIVNIASIAGLRFTVPHIAYAASKAGVIALTRDLAVELGPDRIRVNAVAPGPIDTQGLLDSLGELDRQSAEQRYLLGRMGRAEDIANAVVFLASGRASYVTGATLPVTGGAELAVRPLF
ncbi:MAG: SDR family oxidoreductase [Proteobacteria bacterium]|nr:SDR family oxidoreductase [Pseudomonadota bacterium]